MLHLQYTLCYILLYPLLHSCYTFVTTFDAYMLHFCYAPFTLITLCCTLVTSLFQLVNSLHLCCVLYGILSVFRFLKFCPETVYTYVSEDLYFYYLLIDIRFSIIPSFSLIESKMDYEIVIILKA